MLVTAPALTGRVGVFADRRDAGVQLAALLGVLRGTDTLVVAIPAGGVPVAAALADALALELAVAPVSKVLFPWTTEAGFGAVAFDGTVWLDDVLISRHRLTELQVSRAVADARAKVERRAHRWPKPQVQGRAVVLVDDGIAGGATMRTALAAMKDARQVNVAVPTAHEAALSLFEPLVTRLAVANVRGGREFAVASAYRAWDDVTEDEAARWLARAR
ncbi:MAG: phosphoribosyltransferase [Myxococcota bacterium]